jgi:predicted TIM-barrel fold metal-dependent hydrolase
VFVECGSMYKEDGPQPLRCVGETEFVNGVAAMSASGGYGPIRACAGIVGHADLTRGGAVREVLEAHLRAGGGRFRGIRHGASHDDDPSVLGPLARAPKGLLASERFREGFAELAPLGLSFDAWLLEPQLPELSELAQVFPETQIILDHIGTPLGIGRYQDLRQERFGIWRDQIRALAERQNVVVKLGGLAMPFAGFEREPQDLGAPASQRLADLWRPYIETCIEAFGVERCMFESNFPVDRYLASYTVLWNALKRLTDGASPEEKARLFRGTAQAVYRLEGLPQ